MRRWLQTRKRRLETRVASDTENGVLRREHQNRQSTCQDAWLEIDANVSHHSCRDTASLTPSDTVLYCVQYSTMCRYHGSMSHLTVTYVTITRHDSSAADPYPLERHPTRPTLAHTTPKTHDRRERYIQTRPDPPPRLFAQHTTRPAHVAP